MIQKHKAVCFTGHRNSPHTPMSGTYQTYKMAQKKGIEIHNLYDDDVLANL